MMEASFKLLLYIISISRGTKSILHLAAQQLNFVFTIPGAIKILPFKAHASQNQKFNFQ